MPPFQPLADYTAPALATEATVRRAVRRAREFVSKNDPAPALAADRMRRTGEALLERIGPPSACAPLAGELDETLLAWSGTPRPDTWLRLVVLPPGDRDGLVESWATRHGHRLIEPPLRSALVDPEAPVPRPLERIDPRGQGVLVLPRMEEWFLRHRNGLHSLRALIDWLASLERHCLIGCDSWAWAFAVKVASADMVLPEPLTFRAYDAPRLRDWLLEAATPEDGEPRTFRRADTGADVFAASDGTPDDDFFADLAARSLGIPWVAWHLWRQSLRLGLEESGEETEPEGGRVEGEDTLWIADPDPYRLPGSEDRAPLLVVQALLLHGSLTAEELRAVLPLPKQVTVVPGLIANRIVERVDGCLAIVPAAYPVIRTAIASAGISLDII